MYTVYIIIFVLYCKFAKGNAFVKKNFTEHIFRAEKMNLEFIVYQKKRKKKKEIEEKRVYGILTTGLFLRNN